MTPRRIRRARTAAKTSAVVIQSPERLSMDVIHMIRRQARLAWPSRRILILDGGMTASVTP